MNEELNMKLTWHQIKCVECGKIIEPYKNKVIVTEQYYEGKRATKRRTVAHYCWDCYKQVFENVEV